MKTYETKVPDQRRSECTSDGGTSIDKEWNTNETHSLDIVENLGSLLPLEMSGSNTSLIGS